MRRINFQLFSWPPIASHLCFLLLGLFASSEYWKSKKQVKSLNPVFDETSELILKLPRKHLKLDGDKELTLQPNESDLIFVLNTKAGKARCIFEEIKPSQWGLVGKEKLWIGFSKENLRSFPWLFSRIISKSSQEWNLVIRKPNEVVAPAASGNEFRACPRLML